MRRDRGFRVGKCGGSSSPARLRKRILGPLDNGPRARFRAVNKLDSPRPDCSLRYPRIEAAKINPRQNQRAPRVYLRRNARKIRVHKQESAIRIMKRLILRIGNGDFTLPPSVSSLFASNVTMRRTIFEHTSLSLSRFLCDERAGK